MLLKQKLFNRLMLAFLVYSITVSAENSPEFTQSESVEQSDNPLGPSAINRFASNWPKFDEVIDGQHIVIPYYDPEVSDVPWQRKKFDLDAFAGLEKILAELVDDVLVKRKAVIHLTVYPFKFYHYVRERKAASAELIKQGVGKSMGDDFVKDTLGILRSLSKYPEPKAENGAEPKKSKEEKRLEAKRISEGLKEFMDLFRKIIFVSKVGKYLDWQNMMIDEKPVAQVLSPFYNYFKKNNPGTLWVMNKVMAFLN